MKNKSLIGWVARLFVATVLFQILFFKLIASQEFLYIFEKIGLEPVGRIFSGGVELIAGILILIPKTKVWGALLAGSTMIGAIFFHCTTLGIEVMGDSGMLFGLAFSILLASCLIIYLYWTEFFTSKYLSLSMVFIEDQQFK